MVVGVGLSPTLFPVSRFYRALPSMLGTPHEKNRRSCPRAACFRTEGFEPPPPVCRALPLSYLFRGLDSNQHTRLQNGSMGRLRSCKGFPAGLTVRCVYSFRHHGKRRTLLARPRKPFPHVADRQETTMHFPGLRLYGPIFRALALEGIRPCCALRCAHPTEAAPVHGCKMAGSRRIELLSPARQAGVLASER